MGFYGGTAGYCWVMLCTTGYWEVTGDTGGTARYFGVLRDTDGYKGVMGSNKGYRGVMWGSAGYWVVLSSTGTRGYRGIKGLRVVQKGTVRYCRALGVTAGYPAVCAVIPVSRSAMQGRIVLNGTAGYLMVHSELQGTMALQGARN